MHVLKGLKRLLLLCEPWFQVSPAAGDANSYASECCDVLVVFQSLSHESLWRCGRGLQPIDFLQASIVWYYFCWEGRTSLPTQWAHRPFAWNDEPMFSPKTKAYPVESGTFGASRGRQQQALQTLVSLCFPSWFLHKLNFFSDFKHLKFLDQLSMSSLWRQHPRQGASLRVQDYSRDMDKGSVNRCLPQILLLQVDRWPFQKCIGQGLRISSAERRNKNHCYCWPIRRCQWGKLGEVRLVMPQTLGLDISNMFSI